MSDLPTEVIVPCDKPADHVLYHADLGAPCPGGRRFRIDIEAAKRAMNEAGWTCDGHEPRWECLQCQRVYASDLIGVAGIVAAALVEVIDGD